jgi:hypothetical protein
MTYTTNEQVLIHELSIDDLEAAFGGAATVKGFLQAVADGAAAGASFGAATGGVGATLAGAAVGGAAGGLAYLRRESFF